MAEPGNVNDADMLHHYSAALDEIWRLRVALEYEAQVIGAHLEMKTFPKSRRRYAEDQIHRMRLATVGATDSHAKVKPWVWSNCQRAVGTLTLWSWENR